MTRKPLALDLPLQGRQWIEASAGTGKTFTLSLLVLRLLLEREVQLPNILAVTFTKAATQELKIKIRAQIKLAQDLLKQDLSAGLDGLDAAAQATATLLQAQRDYFGAHTYERIDRPGIFHTDWTRTARK